ncbi:hypothetical protein F0U62_13590 [Cystobacter fuscus]|nr:hypothetical protein F0U62_13590 [Cystobacter fuscus]
MTGVTRLETVVPTAGGAAPAWRCPAVRPDVSPPPSPLRVSAGAPSPRDAGAVHPLGSLLRRPPSAALLGSSAPALTLHIVSIPPIRPRSSPRPSHRSRGCWPA